MLRTMRSRGARAVAVMLIAAGALATAGCSGSGVPRYASCLPARMNVDPAIVAPGDVVTVSADPPECDLNYEPGHQYIIRLRAVGVSSPPIRADVDRDGRFSTALPIPADFPLGPATVDVTGSPYDECGKSGSGSCAGYTVAVEVR